MLLDKINLSVDYIIYIDAKIIVPMFFHQFQFRQ